MRRVGWLKRLLLRRCVGSHHLDCGCSVGVYETYAGRMLLVVDVVHPRCNAPTHVENAVVDAPATGTQKPNP